MTAQRIGFVSLRTERLAETVALLRDVLKVPVTRQADDLVGFRLADGALIELYGPGDEFHSFFITGPVVGFRVDDFEAAQEAMIAAGIEFIGEVQRAVGDAWQHFRAPNGTIMEIIGRDDGVAE